MSDEFLAAIGAVTVNFAMLEGQLEFAIWSMLGITKLEHQAMGRIVTAELSFRVSLNLFLTLVKHWFPNHSDVELRKLRKDAAEAERERNVIIHSTWALAEEGKVVRIKTTAKGKLDTKFEKLSASDIRAIAARIHDAAEDITNFHLALIDPNHTRVTLP